MKFRITLKTNTGTIVQQESASTVGDAKKWFDLLWENGKKDFKSNKWDDSWQGEGFVIVEYFDNAGANCWKKDGEHRLTERKPHASKFLQYLS